MTARTETPRLDRIRGSLLGGAIGDALGAAIEFLDLAAIRARFGQEGIRTYAPAYGRDAGAITDDTQMTLFTAEALLRNDDMHASYMRWLRTQTEPFTPGGGGLLEERALWSRRGPGNTCLSALHAGAKPFARNDSKGCGGIMRIAPIGLVSASPFDDAVRAARVTHGHPAGYLSAGVFAQVISSVCRGSALRPAIDAARVPLERAEREAGNEETSRAIEGALRLADKGGGDVESLGGGWVGEEALAIALYCGLVASDFDGALRLAVNHGGDSDSTGALVGNLLGVAWGIDAIDESWLAPLELRDVIERIASELDALG